MQNQQIPTPQLGPGLEPCERGRDGIVSFVGLTREARGRLEAISGPKPEEVWRAIDGAMSLSVDDQIYLWSYYRQPRQLKKELNALKSEMLLLRERLKYAAWRVRASNFCAGSFGCLPDDQLDDCEDIANLLEELPGAVEELLSPVDRALESNGLRKRGAKLNPMALFTHRLDCALIPVGVTMQRSRSGVDWVRFLDECLQSYGFRSTTATSERLLKAQITARNRALYGRC